MPTHRSPGVRVDEDVDEDAAGPRPIEGVDTAVAAFVGVSGRGPSDAPTLVTAWEEFVTTFGGEVDGSYLARSVHAYLQNGGSRCYVVRVGGDGGPAAVPWSRLSADDFVGDVAGHRGIAGLEAVDEVTVLCVPDLMAAHQRGAVDLEAVRAVQLAMIAHCERTGDRMALVDPPPGLDADGVQAWRADGAGYDSAHAALYWPWVEVRDPLGGGTTGFVPPGGPVAGVWARNDAARGVHEAPANEGVLGALSLEATITRDDQERLNPLGINCLRSFPARGIVVWGARTLSSDPQWRYLNVRRLITYLEESILAGTAWSVFEPNGPALWARLRETVGSFLADEWRRGALAGATPRQAFYVRCDAETNPPGAVDAGQVSCEVGVAPQRPAEFVVFRTTQLSGGTDPVSEISTRRER